MKTITYAEFVRLLKHSDKFFIDGNEVEAYVEEKDYIHVNWPDSHEHGDVEIDIHSDYEFYWDSKSGKVEFIDEENLRTIVRFFVMNPLTKIPKK